MPPAPDRAFRSKSSPKLEPVIRYSLTHVITGLGRGGAEASLARLAAGLARREVRQSVFSLTGLGPKAQDLQSIPVPVAAATASTLPGRWWQLRRHLQAQRPDVVQTWMYHADLLGGLASRSAGQNPVFWNVRRSTPDSMLLSLSTRLVVKSCALSSRWLADEVVYCGPTARLRHEAAGYRPRRSTTIMNGFDSERFYPDYSRRAWLRHELRVKPDAVLLGVIARFDQQKGHHVLLDAVAPLVHENPGLHLVCCGKDVDSGNRVLNEQINRHTLGGRVHLLGERDDIPAIFQGLTLACSPSLDEGVPNSVAEAMLCEVPCIATDVGDTAKLIAEHGWLVESASVVGLRDGLLKALSQTEAQRSEHGRGARRHILTNFSLSAMIESYDSRYRAALKGTPSGSANR